VPSEYEPTREPLIKKMFFERQTHSMGKNARGECSPKGDGGPCWLR
jgi:hypothetical protein